MVNDSESLSNEVEAVQNTLTKIIVPKLLNTLCPVIGLIYDLAYEYQDQRASQNMEALIKELNVRVVFIKLLYIINKTSNKKI